jgi:hypothetical protein
MQDLALPLLMPTGNVWRVCFTHCHLGLVLFCTSQPWLNTQPDDECRKAPSWCRPFTLSFTCSTVYRSVGADQPQLHLKHLGYRTVIDYRMERQRTDMHGR